MSTVLFTSVSGAPGVTTAALAMTMSWQRPALLLEADVTRYSSIMPGYLRGQVPHNRGMNELAVQAHASADPLSVHHLYGQSISLDDEKIADEGSRRRLVPGFRDPAGAESWRGLWGALGAASAAFDASGADVLIDAGRWLPSDPRASLLAQVDAAVVLVHPDLPSVVAALQRIKEMREVLASAAAEETLLVATVEAPKVSPIASREIEQTLGTRVVGSLPWDPRTASIFSHGEPAGGKFNRSRYGRAITQLRAVTSKHLQERRSLLNRYQMEAAAL